MADTAFSKRCLYFGDQAGGDAIVDAIAWERWINAIREAEPIRFAAYQFETSIALIASGWGPGPAKP